MAVRGERDRTAIPYPATKHITSVSPVALVDELRIRWVVDEGKWGDCKSWWWSVHRNGSHGTHCDPAVCSSRDQSHSVMSLEPCTPTFPSLPTELLILILSYLPVVELWTIHNIVAESAHLQYVLRTQLNGVDGLFPPDRPFSERLELLRCHENAWSNCSSNPFMNLPPPIAESLQYGYVDLLSITPKEDLRWVHISREDLRHPLCVVFAVDHNLAVVLSRPGTPHPLSSKPTVHLPSNTVVDVAYAEAEIVGDYVLTTMMSGRDVCCFYLVSWKSGAVTLLRDIELSNTWRPLWLPRLVDIDGSLIMLANCTKNSLEICKLELASQEPRLQTVCFLDGTIGLLVEHEMRTASIRHRGAALCHHCRSSDTDTDDAGDAAVRTLFWPEWGPPRRAVPKPAGPFWIASFSPLVIRDYDRLRMRSTRSTTEESTEVLGEHWVEGKLETHLPYRDLVASELYCLGIVADREWVIRISVRESEGLYYHVYHVG
ncbi:hypothetical protein BJV77DRAFT_1037705 [Russula vinacea]|nr:hypothetical protein BJV77DRAFT_1037705 [Russula vinacea]